MTTTIRLLITLILFLTLNGCDNKSNNQNLLNDNQINLNCKFKKDSSIQSLFIHIEKNNIELQQIYFYEDNEKFYDTTSEITNSIIKIKNYRKNSINKDSFLEHNIKINRFTGEIKQTIVGYFPKEIEERNRKNNPIQILGDCETLKDRKF